MTATKILNSVLLERYAAHPKTASQVLTQVEQQRLFCLKKSLEPLACPNCLTPVSQVDCSGVELDEFDPDGYTRYDHKCPVCDTELVHVVLFMCGQKWRRKHPNIKAATKES